jgi:hypothetical protein
MALRVRMCKQPQYHHDKEFLIISTDVPSMVACCEAGTLMDSISLLTNHYKSIPRVAFSPTATCLLSLTLPIDLLGLPALTAVNTPLCPFLLETFLSL